MLTLLGASPETDRGSAALELVVWPGRECDQTAVVVLRSSRSTDSLLPLISRLSRPIRAL